MDGDGGCNTSGREGVKKKKCMSTIMTSPPLQVSVALTASGFPINLVVVTSVLLIICLCVTRFHVSVRAVSGAVVLVEVGHKTANL